MIGVIAAGVGTILGILYTEGLPFKLAFAVTYLAVIWICLEAVRIPDLRDLIRQGYQSTMRLTSMVVFILIGSTCFSVVFLGVSGGVWLEHMLTSVPGGVWGFLIFINLFIFFLAFFLDFFEIAFIILPMVAPIAQKILTPVVGADAALIWFGVMICVNVQTSFLHPPFGFALFYLRGVAPKEVKSSDIYWGAVPWIGLQVIMVVLVIAFPWTVTALLDKPVSAEEASKMTIEVPQVELPLLDFGQQKSQ
jgi:TRAP-type mannitol/chloroaromatic compound transport system permease large subunit